MMAAAAAMQAQAAQPSPDASSAAYPRWVMLQKEFRIEVDGSSCSTSGDSKTLAAARTSAGHLIQVSLRLAEPPGVSCVCLQIPDGGLDATFSRVIAAHGDSVLMSVCIVEKDPHRCTEDHFVYKAGAAAADSPRPPTMSLLPRLPPFRAGLFRPAGLVCREDDLVVVGHVASVPAGPAPDTPELMREADLCLFRSGKWSIKRLQIRFPDDDAIVVPDQLPSLWDAVVPVGDGLLCWVESSWHHGVVLCDVFEETPRPQYLPLPRDNTWGPPSNRNVCATAGGGELKFVNIFPRYCCGEAGGPSWCRRSCHAYTIQTWTMMRIGDGDMEWVMDGVVDSTELWGLDSYKGLRCFPLNHPVVSLEQPELICFWLHEPPVDGHWFNDKTVDVLMVNMRSKTIHCVSRYEDGLSRRGGALIPSSVSYFFNSDLGSGSDAIFTGQGQDDIDRPPPVIVDEQNASNPTTLQPALVAEPSVQASEIFEAFQEIPSYGLDDDELKAYRILSRDNCSRFKSLSRLPKNLRKDWLLMEIKASED